MSSRRNDWSAFLEGNKTKERKYKNKKTEIDGHKFDSLKEARRYQELQLMVRAKIIRNLDLQPKFLLCGPVKDPATGKQLRARYYLADFRYVINETNEIMVEDVKSAATAKDKTYRLKRHFFLDQYGDDFKFQEV